MIPPRRWRNSAAARKVIMPRIDVNLPANSYSITIEHGLLAHVGTMAAGVIRSRRAMLVVDAAIAKNHGGAVERSLRQAGFEVTMHHVRATEADKSLETAQAVYHAMLNARMDRSSCLIAMGGGIVGDVAGFAASDAGGDAGEALAMW